MSTQTALAHWPLTDPEWFVIDPAEWQEGQMWSTGLCTVPRLTCKPSTPARAAAFVAQLMGGQA